MENNYCTRKSYSNEESMNIVEVDGAHFVLNRLKVLAVKIDDGLILWGQ